MNIALLIGADPRKVKEGPVCLLPAGNWEIKGEGIQDTIFAFSLNLSHSLHAVDKETKIRLDAGAKIQIFILTPGKESHISIRAELINEHRNDSRPASIGVA